MGIPHLTQWLRSTFPDAFALEADLQAEHVYLDVNCILHEALGALGGSAPEDTFLRHVFQRLDLILAQIRCSASLYLALDGAAAAAKVAEQRRRRRARQEQATTEGGRDMEGPEQSVGGVSTVHKTWHHPSVARMAKKRQRCSDLLDHLLPKLFAEQNEDQALRLGHLALISDEPDNAEKLAHDKRCKNVLDVCWQVIGSDILTSHDDSISILVNLLATRSEVFRGLAEFAREKGSIEMLLKHVDMPALGHHLVKAVSRCGNVEERDVAQACSLTAASMENAEDRVAFCNFIISQDGGDSFMLKLFEPWHLLDSFLISPVDNLMWDAQTANRQEFAEKWLTFLIRQFLEPATESTTSMHALGDTLQVKDSTFRQILLTQESLLEHLVSNLVVSLLTNRQDQCRIRAAMYAALHVASSREPSALKHLANHARFDTLVALAVENMQLAMEEIGERKEHDIINVLTIFLQNEATKKAAAWLQHRHLAAKFVIGYRCHDGDVARVRRHVLGHGGIDKPLNKLAATFMDEAPAKQRSAEAAAPEKGQSKTQLTNYILKELISGSSNISY
eukprot:s1170_g16.t1